MKKIYLILTIILFASVPKLLAQWEKTGYMVVGSDTVSGGNFKGFGNNVYSCTSKGIFRSGDNGETWTNITSNDPAIQNESMLSIFIADNGDIYAGSTKKLFKSFNNGTSWIWLNSAQDTISYNDIIEINGNIVASYSVGFSFGGAYFSTDAGVSWTKSTGLVNLPMYYFLADGNILFLGGRDGVYKSIDNGKTWETAGTGFPVSSGPRTIIKSGQYYFAADVGGNGLFASFDNAVTWSNVNPAVFNNFCQVFSITGGSGMIIATMDGACNGGAPIKMSSDNGTTWVSFMDGLTAGFYPSVGKNSSGTLFFTKKGTVVYRYGSVTGINDNYNTPLNFALSQNYPNPFNPSTSIGFRVSEFGFVSLKVYDVLGREVTTLVNEELSTGTYNYNFDASKLTSGIYFYKISAGNFVETKKMILIK